MNGAQVGPEQANVAPAVAYARACRAGCLWGEACGGGARTRNHRPLATLPLELRRMPR